MRRYFPIIQIGTTLILSWFLIQTQTTNDTMSKLIDNSAVVLMRQPTSEEIYFNDGSAAIASTNAISSYELSQYVGRPVMSMRSIFLVGGIIGINGIGVFYAASGKKKETETQLEDDLDSYERLHGFLSHEQKNTLALLRTHLENQGDIEGLKYVDRMKDTVDDVLTLSDGLETQLTPVDVVMVIAEVVDAYQHEARIDFEFEEDLMILSREKWIYRAVANIVDNAIKYSKGNAIKVSTYEKHQSVIIKVEDRGIGIQEDKIEDIFNPHVRLNELKKDGYGIGLSLVSHVCDLSQGSYWIDSDTDLGTTIYLSFPVLTSN